MQRINTIQQRLQEAFTPTDLQVIDDSEQHIGHAGSKGGAGHYTIVIAAESFNKLSRIEAHRKIYDVLNDLIPEQIHALRIKLV